MNLAELARKIREVADKAWALGEPSVSGQLHDVARLVESRVPKERWNFQGVSDEEVLYRYKIRLLQLEDHAIEASEILRRMKQ